jgi:hypothetical protein
VLKVGIMHWGLSWAGNGQRKVIEGLGDTYDEDILCLFQPICMQHMQGWFNIPIDKAQPNKIHNVYG